MQKSFRMQFWQLTILYIAVFGLYLKHFWCENKKKRFYLFKIAVLCGKYWIPYFLVASFQRETFAILLL